MCNMKLKDEFHSVDLRKIFSKFGKFQSGKMRLLFIDLPVMFPGGVLPVRSQGYLPALFLPVDDCLIRFAGQAFKFPAV